MSRSKKILFWAIGGIGILLTLLLAVSLLVPRFVNLELYREKILAEFSRTTKGEVAFQEIHFSFFPRPKLKVHQGRISRAGEFNAVFESLSIIPGILPLLKGEIRVRGLRVETPEVTINLPERIDKNAESRNEFSVEANRKKLFAGLGFLAARIPGLALRIKNGKIYIFQGQKPRFWFKDVQARIKFPPGELRMDIHCKSNFGEKISLNGSINPENFKSTGHLEMIHLQPQELITYFYPVVSSLVKDAQLNLNIDFKTDGLGGLQAEVQGSIPFLTLYLKNRKTVFKGKGLKIFFYMSGGKTTVVLNKLDLDSPQLHMAGQLDIDPTSPRIRLKLEGREIDVASTREAVIALAGNIPAVQDTFNIIKGGTVSLITFHSQGRSVADLANAKNIFIKGRMLGGEIFIPKADLNFENVNGDVVISEGILEGKDLEVRLGNSTGSSGRLKLGLAGTTPPFHLDMNVNADLSQLPPILQRLVGNKSFVKEITLIDHLKGNATGKLVLGESLESLKVDVDVSELDLTTRYQRIPFPLEIHGGQFSYGQNEILAKDIAGRLGTSSFSHLSARFDWNKEPFIEIQSGRSEIVLEEIYPWLLTFEKLKNALTNYPSMNGRMRLSSLDFKGPLFKPDQWRFQTNGEVRNLVVNTPFIPGPVSLSFGKFTALPKTFSLVNAQSTILDASLSGSCVLYGYLEGLQKADVIFQGNMGPEAIQWTSNLISLPSELGVQSPLSVSRAHLKWDRGATNIAFTGKLDVKNGPGVSMEVLLNSEELMIKDLLIQDKTSQASFALARSKKAFDLDFKGNLDKSTVDELLTNNQFLSGWIKGDFRARILLDQPMHSRVWGKLQATGLELPWKLKAPVKIDQVSLDSADHMLKIESAVFRWEESRLTLDGTVNISTEKPQIDLTLSADCIDWNKIEKILNRKNNQSDSQSAENLWSLPIQGNLRVQSECFKYGRFALSPFRADITFDQEGMDVDVIEASLCGISLPGSLNIAPQQRTLNFKPISKNLALDTTLTCLGKQERIVTGNFDLNGTLSALVKNEEVLRALRGDFELNAKKGRIYRYGLVSKIFGFLNVAGIIKGDLPEFSKDGFPYHSINATADLENGKLMLKEAILVSPSMDIACQGEIDIIDQKVNLRLLVVPLKTVNFAVNKIPLLHNIFGKNLVSVPLKASGDLADMKVTPFSPSAMGSGLLGIMKKTLQLPTKIIKTVPSGEIE